MATPSRKKAIDDFCKQCIYDPHGDNGTWRQQVERCTSVNCALYPVRPKTTKSKVIATDAEE